MLTGFIKPVEPSLPINFQFEQKFSLMTSLVKIAILTVNMAINQEIMSI